MRTELAPKTVKRLLAADGFLDLGMPERAVEELEKIADAGVLEGPRQLLHGVALRTLEDHRAAIPHLEKAARLMPSPARRFAWNELSICYKAVGSSDMCELAEKLAGNDDLQLRIALPFASATIEFKMSPSSARTT